VGSCGWHQRDALQLLRLPIAAVAGTTSRGGRSNREVAAQHVAYLAGGSSSAPALPAATTTTGRDDRPSPPGPRCRPGAEPPLRPAAAGAPAPS